MGEPAPRRRKLMGIASGTDAERLYAAARRRIPGGTQLLSKRPEMFLPSGWPIYYSRAQGAEVWDLDGRRFVDMSISGVGACILGFADPDVNTAVKAAIDAGSMATLNCPEELELAELLCELHPWADMVRFGRSGGEAMAIAVRVARAATGRDLVAFCGYHGWHDWYLAANLAGDSQLDGHLLPGLQPAGVPRALVGTARPFMFNDARSLEAVTNETADRLAAVVMEPVRSHDPDPGFLEACRDLAHDAGAVLVFDEVTSGWRLTTGGAHLRYECEPDVAVFAKGMSNGFPMAAIIGRASVMDAAQDSFISSTYWTERIGPVAALATIRKHRELDVPRHLISIGSTVQGGWTRNADAAGLRVTVTGIPPLAHFEFDDPEAQVMRTLFTRMMLSEGFLAGGSFYATLAHSEAHVESYLAAVSRAFRAIRDAASNGTLGDLAGPVAHSGFKRLA